MAIEFYEQGSIFDELFEDIESYVKNIAWEYNETNYIVNFKVPTRSDVNVDVPGTYLIADELIVCDETFSFEYQLEYKDKYEYEVDYFIDEYNQIKVIDEYTNNTIFGQYGLRFFIGNSFSKTNMITPSVYFMLNEERGLSPLETKHNSLEKELIFDIGLVVGAKDVFENDTAYKSYNSMKKFMFKTIGEYFNYCDEINEIAQRIFEWTYSSKILHEDRLGDTPFVRGTVINTLTYR